VRAASYHALGWVEDNGLAQVTSLHDKVWCNNTFCTFPLSAIETKWGTALFRVNGKAVRVDGLGGIHLTAGLSTLRTPSGQGVGPYRT
jgi:hypothetical protein